MSDASLFQPSLQEETVEPVKTYNLSHLFLVAFFGGTLPMLILATRNAKWLQVEQRKIRIFLVIGSLILLFYPIGSLLNLTNINLRLITRLLNVLLYQFGYRSAMRESYRLRMMFDYDTEPLLTQAVLWSVLGFGINLAIYGLGQEVIHVFF